VVITEADLEHGDGPNIVASTAWATGPCAAADGTTFAAGSLVHGAYPWLMPSGDAIRLTAANMACRAVEDPPGCGPRRNALSVVGYPRTGGSRQSTAP